MVIDASTAIGSPFLKPGLSISEDSQPCLYPRVNMLSHWPGLVTTPNMLLQYQKCDGCVVQGAKEKGRGKRGDGWGIWIDEAMRAWKSLPVGYRESVC